MLLVGRPASDRFARSAVYDNVFDGVCLGLMAMNYVQNILVGNSVVLQYMLAHFLNADFNTWHIIAIAQDSDNVIPRHYSKSWEQRFQHLKVGVVNTIEDHRVNVLQNYMLLYQVA